MEVKGKKLEELTFVEYMNTLFKYSKENWDNKKCDQCGGVGIVPVMCCSGKDCTCVGLPVDFKLECKICGAKPPDYIFRRKEILFRRFVCEYCGEMLNKDGDCPNENKISNPDCVHIGFMDCSHRTCDCGCEANQ